jgi:co-chaperonin GroES (HSP10)
MAAVDGLLQPLDDHVTLIPSSDEEERASGLVLPNTSSSVLRSGIVLRVGADATGVRPGDRVLYRRDRAIEVRLPPEPVVLLRREDVIARFVD